MLGFVERHAFAAPRQDGPYWLGAELSLADLAFYPWFEQVCVLERHFGFHMPVELPRLRTWWATVAARLRALHRQPTGVLPGSIWSDFQLRVDVAMGVRDQASSRDGCSSSHQSPRASISGTSRKPAGVRSYSTRSG